MAAPAIYRSTDTNAPPLFGLPGQLNVVLEAILVNGYGSSFATGTITGDGTNVADGDTVTVGSQTYTFKTTAAAPNQISVGGTATISLTSLVNAINGLTAFNGTPINSQVWASLSGSVITVTARKGGTSGNSIALARASGTPHLAVSGATLTGGGGTDSKAGAGWTKPYAGVVGTTILTPCSVFRQPAGSGFYLQVDEGSNFGTSGGRDARLVGFETMSAYNTGTGQFPTTVQAGSWVPARKSSVNDTTARPWICFVDDRTLYFFALTGDLAGNYHGFAFGDFYSLLNGDAYKCMLMGTPTENSSPVNSSMFGQHVQPSNGVAMSGHFLPRNYTGVGGSLMFAKTGDTALSNLASTTPGSIRGDSSIAFPNQSDGGLYLAPLRIFDGNTPSGSSLGPVVNNRGRLRGMYQVCHPGTVFSDGDTFAGSGDYAGRNFVIMKYLVGTSSNQAFVAMETTAWETSS
jgi:hypothetical protein